jgi:hypothetical protein
MFALSLSGCVDIYSVYGVISMLLQTVNMLPFERMQKFQQLIKKLQEMVESIRLDDCPCSMFATKTGEVDKSFGVSGKVEVSQGILEEVCLWPAFHKDAREVLGKGQYQGVVLGQLRQDVTRTRAGNQEAREWLGEDRESVVERVCRRLEPLANFIQQGLDKKVYSSHDLTVIKHIQRLLDLKTIVSKIKNSGPAYVSNLSWRGFKESAIFLEDSVLDRVPEEELRTQFREIYQRLALLAEEKNSTQLTNLKILDGFLDPKQNNYKDIEGVLSVLAKAAVVKGVEAVVEGWVSVMERHCTDVRGITNQSRIEDMMWVALNGPELAHCDAVVKEAMVSYWGEARRVGDRRGHFIRRSNNVKSYLVSEAIDKIIKKPPRLPFMV